MIGVFFSDWYRFHLWQGAGEDPPVRWSDLPEREGLFPDSGIGERGYDASGWRYPGARNMHGVQSIVDALAQGTPPTCRGEDMQRALELGIALRESHRQDHRPVKLPLPDRSLKIMPAPGRWLNKKEVQGEEWYAQQMESWIQESP